MTWFYATSVSVTNGATVVSVNAGDDIAIIQPGDGLVIGTQPPVEVKRTYLDGSSNKKIELLKPWPYGSQSNQPAEAYPTAGDFQAATAVLKQLIESFALATQAEAQAGTENTKPMTALRVKQAMDAQLGTASTLTATTSTTDSAQGRALRVGDFGIGAAGNTSVYSGDIALISATGVYSGGPAATGGPAGVSLDGAKIFHLKWADPNSATQIIYTYAGPSYSRNITGGVALAWRQEYNTANALGTVAFSSGVNTGAIIERGSNPNGEYTKFADGTMICWFSRSSALGMASYSSGIYVGDFVWFFPAQFNGGVGPVWGSHADSVTKGWLSCSSLSTSQATVNCYSSAPSNTGTLTLFAAVGRWR